MITQEQNKEINKKRQSQWMKNLLNAGALNKEEKATKFRKALLYAAVLSTVFDEIYIMIASLQTTYPLLKNKRQRMEKGNSAVTHTVTEKEFEKIKRKSLTDICMYIYRLPQKVTTACFI